MIKSKPVGKAKTSPAKSVVETAPKKTLWLDLLYIFLLLMAVASVYKKVYDEKLFLGGDNVVYYINATAIAHGQGYTNINSPTNSPANQYPPGYPLISAGLMKIFGNKIDVMNKANGFFLFGALVFLYLILFRFTKNKHLSFVIAVISAMNMHILSYAIIAMSEIPFLFTSLAAIYFLMRTDKKGVFYKDKYFWLFIFFWVLSYYIRSAGLALIGGVILYFVFEKNWKMAGVVTALFVLFAFPWYLRGKSLGGSTYVSQLLMKNPYQPELGAMEGKDWLIRAEKNAKRYVSLEIPSALLSYKVENYKEPSATDKKWMGGALLAILAIIGVFRVREYRWLVLGYMAGSGFIMLFWPDAWYGTRFILGAIPMLYALIILALYDGALWISDKMKLPDFLKLSLLPFLFLTFIPYENDGIDYLSNAAKGGMATSYTNYFEIAKWTKANLPANSVVICRKPELFYLYANCKTANYMYTLNADSLIADMKSLGATHVVLEQLGFASTGRYLYPAIQKFPEKFKMIQHLENPDTYLFEINYNSGYTGELKDGKRNGKGSSRFADGSSYDGYWKDDLKDGEGVFTWPNGLKYTGHFTRDLRNGEGVMNMANGQILKAVWVNDTLNGYGKLFNPDGKIAQEGLMKNNEFVDKK